MKPLFELGRTVATATVASKVEEGFLVPLYLHRHHCGDWGDLCKDDKKANEDALKDGDRILSAYETSFGRIYIITEWDRSYTTVMFCDEY